MPNPLSHTSQGAGCGFEVIPCPGVSDLPSLTTPYPASSKLDSSPVLSPGNKAKPDDHRSRPGRPAVSQQVAVVALPSLVQDFGASSGVSSLGARGGGLLCVRGGTAGFQMYFLVTNLC